MDTYSDENIIISHINNCPSKKYYFSNGVLTYDFKEFKINKLHKLEKKLDETKFQIIINTLLRSLIFKEDLELFKMVLPYWKKGDIGMMMRGHPFLHELAHQYYYNLETNVNNQEILKCIYSHKLSRDLFNNEKYLDKYGNTPNMRIEGDFMRQFINNIIEKYKIIDSN